MGKAQCTVSHFRIMSKMKTSPGDKDAGSQTGGDAAT
jgi:hypothetical protein